MQAPITRICKKCGKEKSLNDFKSNRSCRFGKEHVCKKCDQNRIKQYNNKNPEIRKEVAKKSYLKYKEDPVRKRRKADTAKRFREADPVRTKIQRKKTYNNNRDKKIKYSKDYRIRFPEKSKSYLSKSISYARNYRKNNQERIKENKRKITANLSTCYIKQCIVGTNDTIKHADISQELVELKRKQLKLKRDGKKEKGNSNK
jgi:hypothetical protein